MLNYVRGTTDGSSGVVTVLGHLVTSSCNNETSCGRDIKGILTVTTSTHNVDIAVSVENCWYTCLQDTVTEAEQFVDGDAAHLQGGQQGCDLLRRILTLSDTNQNILHFFTRQFLVVQHPVQDVFHRLLCHDFIFFATDCRT